MTDPTPTNNNNFTKEDSKHTIWDTSLVIAIVAVLISSLSAFLNIGKSTAGIS